MNNKQKELNIKRRIYDSINVMIATGIFAKRRKMILGSKIPGEVSRKTI